MLSDHLWWWCWGVQRGIPNLAVELELPVRIHRYPYHYGAGWYWCVLPEQHQAHWWVVVGAVRALYRAAGSLPCDQRPQVVRLAVLTELPGCSALWELRSGTTDYDFAVREAEYQLEFPALTVTRTEKNEYGETVTITEPITAQVEVRVDINRRPWNGGSPWMLYRTDTYGPMTITGGQTFEGVVPNARGYETIITNVRYRVVG